MEYLDKAILKKYQQYWITLRDAGFIKNLNKKDVEEIESVYKRLIDKNFYVNKWCMSCVADMLRVLYLATKFDTLDEDKPVDSIIVAQLTTATDEQTIWDATLMDGLEEEPAPQPKKRGRKKKK